MKCCLFIEHCENATVAPGLTDECVSSVLPSVVVKSL